MDYLHKKNYIHRDLKPENILLDDYLFPQICDFGLSKCYDPDGMSSLTVNCGTVAYMAPEVFQGNKYDPSVDVYSYGLIMFEVITGKALYPKKITQFELQSKVGNGYRSQFPEGYNINEKIVELINNCWSSDPSIRPSFEEIAEILEDDEIVSWFEIDNDDFNIYSSIINKEPNSSVQKITDDYINRSTSSKIRRVDISDSFEQFSKQKIVEYEDVPAKASIYPASKFVFLDEKCQKLVKMAESGDSNMMVAVADSLINGTNGFPKNIEIGVKFLKSATDQKNIEASELYASMLIKGDLIPANVEKAEQIVDFLMKNNCPNARRMWAQIELTKSQPDFQKVRDWLKESASDGNVDSMILYAKFCLMKKEITQIEPNEEEAIKYIKLASESGNEEARKMMDDFTEEKEKKKKKEEEEEEKKRRRRKK